MPWSERKALWTQAGNRCAYPGCQTPLTQVSPTTGVQFTIGEEAHIRAETAGGPRWDSAFPIEKINLESNRVLLCPVHHREIDADVASWPISRVIEIKQVHKNDVEAAMSPQELVDVRLELELTARVDLVSRMLLIPFRGIVDWLNLPIPRMRESTYEQLESLGESLVAYSWPQAFPKMKIASERLRQVIGGVLNLVQGEFEDDGTIFQLTRAYRNVGPNSSDYDELLINYRTNVQLLNLLAYQLARATNLFILAVREELDEYFRFNEGWVLMELVDSSQGFQLCAIEYRDPDWEGMPTFPMNEQLVEMIRAGASSRAIEIQRFDVSEVEI